MHWIGSESPGKVGILIELLTIVVVVAIVVVVEIKLLTIVVVVAIVVVVEIGIGTARIVAVGIAAVVESTLATVVNGMTRVSAVSTSNLSLRIGIGRSLLSLRTRAGVGKSWEDETGISWKETLFSRFEEFLDLR